MIDIESIRQRHDAATPGPWTVTGYHEDGLGPHIEAAGDVPVCVVTSSAGWEDSDARFIALAHDDVGALLAEVARLTTDIESIRAALGHGADENLWPPGLTVGEAVERLACAFPSPL